MYKKIFVLFLTFSIFSNNSKAADYNQLITFGDSTVDTGWLAHASTGDAAEDAAIAAAIAADGNAYWTGPGDDTKFLAYKFGLPANPANVAGGTNYAIGGAFDYQGVGAYAGHGTSLSDPSLPGTATQIENYLTAVGGVANPNAIYFISSGGDSVFAAANAYGSDASLANPYLNGEAQHLANSIRDLHAAGARTILIGNEYTTPSSPGWQSAYLRTITNATWNDLAAQGVSFIPADTYTVIQAVENNPTAFGITAPITSNACIFPFAGAVCVPTSTPSASYAYLVSANALHDHLFLDGTHLTQAGDQIQADYYYSLLVAPSQASYLAESAVRTTLTKLSGIEQQIRNNQTLSKKGWDIWTSGQLSYLQMDNSVRGFPSDPATPLSGTFGIDYQSLAGWMYGMSFSYQDTRPSFSTGGGYTLNDSSISLYSAYHNKNWSAHIISDFGLLQYDVNRQVPIGITTQYNRGSALGYDIAVGGEAEYDFHYQDVTHGPVVGFIAQHTLVGSYSETGSFTSLNYGTQKRESDVSNVGYRLNIDLGAWQPYAEADWDHEWARLDRMVMASLTTTSAPPFSMPAVVLGRDWASVTLGTQYRLTSSLSASASTNAEIGQSNATNFGGLVGINYHIN